jgi:hypothetical protein
MLIHRPERFRLTIISVGGSIRLNTTDPFDQPLIDLYARFLVFNRLHIHDHWQWLPHN